VDYSVTLAIVLAVTGAIWLGEAWTARQLRLEGAPPAPPSWAVIQARAVFLVLLAIAVLRSCVLEPYQIPSRSMMPSLIAGDFILVSKLAYGLRLPLSDELIIPSGLPRRGDVIVFRSTTQPRVLVKRLVGLPGDHVQVRDNRVWINGRLVPLYEDGPYDGVGGFAGARRARERLDGHEHDVLLVDTLPTSDFDAVVPANSYFFMGDNRNDSEDSRFPQLGFVPQENLIGPAFLIWMSWPLPGWPLWERIGQRIR
jgi:signal peptidase I